LYLPVSCPHTCLTCKFCWLNCSYGKKYWVKFLYQNIKNDSCHQTG
jgi:hypothetical protein